ncbi:MAG: hypothetical protein ACI841_000544 [Planctomycetota bacterium]|jgi:hypothetical protein
MRQAGSRRAYRSESASRGTRAIHSSQHLIPHSLLPMRLFLSLLALLLFGSCASTSINVESGTPIEVHYYGQKHLSIVNDSWMIDQDVDGGTFEERRNSFTSSKGGDPFTKVLADSEMIGLLQAFAESDLVEPLLQTGLAPAGGSYGNAIEIRTGQDHQHAISHPGMSIPDQKILRDGVMVFQAVYNAILQYSSVPEAVGREMLEETRSAGAKQ